MKPQISMIILSYNGGERLIPTLESHKLQTYKNKELIISDDASPDGITPKIIENWLSKNERYFKRVVFMKNEVNAGAVKNWYNASTKATGDVIFTTEQGDLIYGPETIERISNEIGKQRLGGLKDPYVWLGHFKSFLMKNGFKKGAFLPKGPTKKHFDLVEKYPEKVLKEAMKSWFIMGPSLIHNSNYFDNDVFPHPASIRYMGDTPCFLWNLINKHRIGIIRQFIRWYESGVGISSRPSPKMRADMDEIAIWLSKINPGIGMEYKIAQGKKPNWQRIIREIIRPFKQVHKYIHRQIWTKIWTKKIEKESSLSFEEKMFSSQYYPDKPDGIF